MIETLIPTEVVDAAWFVGVRNALDLCFIAFVVGGQIRRSAVRGTQVRYRWATIQRACCWPALLFLGMTIIRSIGLTQWYGLVLIPISMAAWAYTFQEMRADGDDDWFSRTGQRLRRRLGALAGTISRQAAFSGA